MQWTSSIHLSPALFPPLLLLRKKDRQKKREKVSFPPSVCSHLILPIGLSLGTGEGKRGHADLSLGKRGSERAGVALPPVLVGFSLVSSLVIARWETVKSSSARWVSLGSSQQHSISVSGDPVSHPFVALFVPNPCKCSSSEFCDTLHSPYSPMIGYLSRRPIPRSPQLQIFGVVRLPFVV